MAVILGVHQMAVGAHRVLVHVDVDEAGSDDPSRGINDLVRRRLLPGSRATRPSCSSRFSLAWTRLHGSMTRPFLMSVFMVRKSFPPRSSTKTGAAGFLPC